MQTLGTWLTNVDQAIIEYYHETGAELPQSPLAHNLPIDATPNHVGRRLSALRDVGIVDKVDGDRGYHGLTELGVQIAEGNLTREEINELEPEE